MNGLFIPATAVLSFFAARWRFVRVWSRAASTIASAPARSESCRRGGRPCRGPGHSLRMRPSGRVEDSMAAFESRADVV
jgi:hypothetical protein